MKQRIAICALVSVFVLAVCSIQQLPAYAGEASDPLSYVIQGNTLDDQGEYEAAIAQFQKAAQIDPTYPLAYQNWGRVLLKMHRQTDAIPEIKKAIALRPDYAMAHFDLAAAYDQLGKNTLAIEEYRQAIDDYAVDQSDPNLTRDLATVHNNLAILLWEKGDSQGAFHELRASMQIDPGYSDPVCDMGNFLYQSGKDDQAIKWEKEAIQISPDNGMAHADLAAAMLDKGDVQNALKEVTVARKMIPDRYEPYLTLGRIYERDHTWIKAKTVLQQAVALSRQTPEALDELGYVDSQLGDDADSIKCCKEALSHDPSDTLARINLGVSLYSSGQKASGREQWNMVLLMGDPWAANTARSMLAQYK